VIAGIDYSMNSPCICICDETKPFNLEACQFHYLTSIKKYEGAFDDRFHGTLYPTWSSPEYRFHIISEWARQRLQVENRVNCVYLEGYAYGAKGKVFHIGENVGVLKHMLWIYSIPYVEVSPTNVKKFATGKGNADKAAMHESFHKKTRINLRERLTPDKKDVTNPVSDIVDSFYLAEICWNALKKEN